MRLLTALAGTLAPSLIGAAVAFLAAPSVLHLVVGNSGPFYISEPAAPLRGALSIALAFAAAPWLGLVAAFVDHLGLSPLSARVLSTYVMMVELSAIVGIALQGYVVSYMLASGVEGGLKPMIALDSLELGQTGVLWALIVFFGELVFAVVRRRRLQLASRP